MARVAIVTGSDSGIGKASAVALAEAGFDVGITWHEDQKGAEDTAAQVRAKGRRAEVRRLDLNQLPEAGGVIDELADALGGLDVFVNNAGTGSSAAFLDLGWEEWRHTVRVDLDGAFVCCQRAARRMVKQGRGGRIITITSVHEHVPLMGSSAYCAAKGGLGLLTKVMAAELGQHQITVNAIAPGEISTPMTDQDNVDPRTVWRPGYPLGRPGDAREVAGLVVFLTTPAAAFITGTSLVIDGGLELMAAIGAHGLKNDDWRKV
ncbi:SDR family oxidoreductase [Archangium violaceum]|uniref:SDR family oxidoreductase n=1 Tax=Archangium violaceum TaxID=83451 RepID=UPI002B283BA4|nr:SDR family oxidoreductase [Archangium violaceum]